MKSLKDYLHLYIGCKVEYLDYIANDRTTGIIVSAGGDWFWVKDDRNGQNVEEAKLILRPLSSMTEEDAGNLGRTSCSDNGGWLYDTKSFQYLLSKGFDLFGLIESGLAIEKN